MIPRQSAAAKSAAGRRAWTLVLYLWLTLLLAYTSRQAIFSIFPVLRTELQFTDVQLGLTGTTFLWVYALVSPFAGRIVDRLSKKKLIVWSVALWSACTIWMGLAQSAAGVLVLRGVLALVQSVYVPAATSLIALSHSGYTRSRAIALHGTGQFMGVAVGGWLGGFLTESFGWRWMFGIIGVATMLYAPILLFRLDAPASESSAAAQAETRQGVWSATFFSLCFCLASVTATLWIVYTWLPDVMRARFELPLSAAGVLATAFVQGSMIGGMFAGATVADRWMQRTPRARLWVMIAGLGICAPFVYWLGQAPTLGQAKLAAIGYGFFTGMFTANYAAACFDIVPPQSRGFVIGFLNCVGGLSGGLAAYLFGLFKARVSVENMFAVVAVIGAAATLILLAITRSNYVRSR